MSKSPYAAGTKPLPDESPGCFLCLLDTTYRCQIPQIEGKIIGARVERREPKQIAVVGIETDAGERVRLNLGPHDIQLVEHLAVLPAETLGMLRLRALHLVPGKANAPAPGQKPFSVAVALPASVAVIQPDLLINITDLS